ncbi:MAG: DUF938 domain-containing protein [Panacagrimonas sp.]
MDKPRSPSCERNRDPILAVLRTAFAGSEHVLEVGSGTGQHAVHFAAALPQLRWQSSDRAENLPGIRAWLLDAGLPNTPDPLVFDVNQPDWPAGPYDGLFTANTLHIMGWDEVQWFFRRLPEILDAPATLVVYGPFNYRGQFTSASNADFDARLKSDDARRGIRDFEAVNALAAASGLALLADHAMPANNRCLVWRRRA